MNNNRVIKSVGIFLFCLVNLSAFAQKGSIEGVIIDKLRAETLVGATVVIQGTTNGTITDFDGKFILGNLAPATYNVVVSFISYKPVVIEGIKVEANKASVINVELEEVTTAIESVTITATRRSNTDVAMISAIKASNIVANGITAQQITRTQDKDASEVIKRVPGISIIEDRFVVVRGLNQRYNSVWINNASTPSSETDQKAFSFDIIPSSMIDNILIAKSPSPELPADFTGGFIKIYTKNMPEKNFFQVGYSSTYNTEDDYSSFQLINKGKYDWLGIDNGERALPDNFPSTLKGLSNSQLATLGKEFNSNWAPKKVTAYPEQKLSINFGRRFQIGDKQIGTITNINYGVANNSDVKILKSYQAQFNLGDTPNYNYNYSDSSFSRVTKIGVLHNWALFLEKGNKIEFRNLLNINGKNTTIVRNGLNGYEGYTVRSYQDKYMSRVSYSGQLGGEHKFGDNDKNKIDWVLGFSYSGKNEPDLKQLRTTLQNDPLFAHYGEYYASVGLTPSVSDAGRLFMRLNEYISSLGFNYERKLKIGNWQPSIKTGIYSEYKDRAFDTRIIGLAKNSSYTESVWLPVSTIFSPDNINTGTDGFIIKETTSKSDSYKANNALMAGYVALSTNITNKIKFYGGVRAEYNSLRLDGYDSYNHVVNLKSNHLDLFPSANLTYNFNEKNLIRLATGLSVNRPEFREIAPFYFYNFEDEADYIGNTELENCYVWNYDLRYEYYPSSSETFSFGVFYKDFKSTIESTYKPAGNRPTYTYNNANQATSLGVEVELRKSLESIELLKDSYIVANAAYIYSKVIFPKGSIFEDREMQGQSPFLINTGIFYSNEKHKINASVQYNVIGDRLVSIGKVNQNADQNIPNIIEKQKHIVDLTVSKEFFNSVEFKFGIRNLLNQKTISYFPYLNGSGDNSLYLDNKRSSDGISFTFGITAKF
ncbi:TonB-dependent receptor [Tenuifilaceae bacterium CYCD]|nr:TonB-dependent receptor [Tenuifilaceae bacterium CYCD]